MIKNIFISLLIFSLVNLYLPRVAFSQVGDIQGRDVEGEITQNLPEMRSTPAENIPVETVEKSGKLWLWVLLGVVAVGAIVAVAASAGGGGGGGGSSSSSSGSNTGSVAVGW